MQLFESSVNVDGSETNGVTQFDSSITIPEYRCAGGCSVTGGTCIKGVCYCTAGCEGADCMSGKAYCASNTVPGC
jgi:hypothetical protein